MRSYCTFRVADCLMGIESKFVQEILRHQRVVPVPLSHKAIKGLFSLRGQLVTVIDLKDLFQFSDRSYESKFNIVIPALDGFVSLLVDKVGDVIELEDDAFETIPATLPNASAQYLLGVQKLRDELLLVVNTEKITLLTSNRG